MKRSNVVRLMTTKEQHEILTKLAIATAKCWNEVNWLRMQQFKEGKKVDFNDTAKKIYQKYKDIIKGANVQQVAMKNAEAWRGFFSLIHEKKDGELSNWLKPRPPGYWKDKDGKLIVFIRNDRYAVDEVNRVIYLKDFKLALKFKGKFKWHGKQGRLEIIYNEARKTWYAYIPVDAVENEEVKGGLKASIDLGIVNLATVFVEDGSWYLFKGGSVLSTYENYSKRITRIQKILARHKQQRSRKLKLTYEKRAKFLKHALNSMIRKIINALKEKGVNEIIIGHPKGIAKNHGNKLTVNFWSYGYAIKRFTEIGEETGLKITTVNEAYTSKTCSLCGEAHNGRVKRGLFKCPRIGKVINADLNGAINILHIPESQGSGNEGKSHGEIGVIGLKTQPLVYRWTNGAGWVKPTSYEMMKMKAVNHKPMNRPKGNPRPLGREGGQVIFII